MEGKKAMQIARTKIAPAFKPNKPESANGFRVMPCMMAPETAKQHPTMAAPIALGIRSSINLMFLQLGLKVENRIDHCLNSEFLNSKNNGEDQRQKEQDDSQRYHQ